MNQPTLQKQMIWNAIGSFIYLVCQWLLVVLVTNMGGFSDAGVLSIAMSVSATFQTVAMFGIRSFQVSDLTEEYTDTHYVGFRLVTCTLSLLLCVVFSLITHYWGIQLLAIFLFMLFRLAESFSDVLHGIAQKNDRLDIAGKSFAIKGIGLLLVFYLSFRFLGNLCFSLFLIAVFSLLSTAFYDWVVVRRLSCFSLLFNPIKTAPMALKTLPLCIYLFFHSALSTVPKIFLERLSGEELLGAYSSIFAPALLISTAVGFLYQPFVAKFATAWHEQDGKRFLKLLFRFVIAIAVIGGLALFVAHFLGEFAFVLIFGEQIREYLYLLTPILVAICGVALIAFLGTVETVLRDFLGLIVGCGVGVAFELASAQWLIRTFGANGASYAHISATTLGSIIMLVRILYLISRKQRESHI